MKRTKIKTPAFNWLDVNEKLTFLGSCFSVHIAKAAREKGFDVLSNPFGVIFNPISLAELQGNEKVDWEDSIFDVEDKYLSWNAHSEIWSKSKSELSEILQDQQNLLLRSIKESNTLFITFGTAWVYELLDENKIVANCHKQPNTNFRKRCLTSDEVAKAWKSVANKLLKENPNLKIVFTVSPVRHKKDGLVENNRSKSELISAVHSIVNHNESCYYFPSYEFVIDELRDYAYFEKDGVHPNKYCIEEIEDLFFDVFLTPSAKKITKEFGSLMKMKNHRPLHPGTNSAIQFERDYSEREKFFLDNHPEFKKYM